MPPAVPPSRDDITQAVRDTVTLRNDSRAKISRTQTPLSPTAAPPSRPPGKRSQSDDSNIVEKPRSGANKPRGKKGSQHADVIDRLDYTSVGPMFHHDGPFDACAPSRNKHRSKAPMYAWGADELSSPSYGDSAYPAPSAYKAFTNDYPEPPKKKVDAIAEAWGIHEPEPFEEFFAGGGSGRPDGDTPASSIYNGRDSHQSSRSAPANQQSRRAKDSRDAREGDRPRIAARRSLVPPPQPIFVGEPAEIEPPPGSPPASAPGFPKRSKSLMQRIRKMRDAPNVPVTADYEQNPPVSPSSPTEPMNASRPTHRPQNSFLGRFGGNANRNPPLAEKPEPFVFIEANNNKELPAPPPVAEAQYDEGQGYFDAPVSAGPTSPGGGLGRKTSLMKKVGRVVRGTK
ncbi:Pal1 cell morphology protein-domain-containing protein [Gymnopilus junonius]|uniref:Pal1 cell morphology protein-domain-containing protein n=1 Tax=Gymnopilus junonius TaxID=109634 RepID=A0A9P5NSU7_GYMJU|nr:Pal1 cell morphology protein-domain-containing protein [Gymnopilus junonius]